MLWMINMKMIWHGMTSIQGERGPGGPTGPPGDPGVGFPGAKVIKWHDFWRSCDTEDWCNDAENKKQPIIFHNITLFTAFLFFIKYHAALVSIRELSISPNPKLLNGSAASICNYNVIIFLLSSLFWRGGKVAKAGLGRQGLLVLASQECL